MANAPKIDFVMVWVDGNDPDWKKEFAKYSKDSDTSSDKDESRYRDWDLLRYWFRGVEKFAPWVNRIHFITCGHIPSWLNTNHPKLNWVKHSDYIPAEYLPTFSSHPIELNLHRIQELEEHFVFFNDDMFLINNVEPERFFNKNGLPCDMAVLNIQDLNGNVLFSNIVHNNLRLINANFNKHSVLSSNVWKWLNFKYGKHLLRTISLLPWYLFPGFLDAHFAQSYLKSTYNEVWKRCNSKLAQTSHTRFRSMTDVNQYIFRYWQLCSGRFHPYNVIKDSVYFDISARFIGNIEQEIMSPTNRMICLNDSSIIKNFEELKFRLQSAFNHLLPERSEFELYDN